MVVDIDGEAESDNSGYSASMSSDGNVVAIGAARNDGTGTDAGHVRVYNAFTAKVSGDAGFRMMSSPVAGQVLGELLTNAWTQGMTGADNDMALVPMYGPLILLAKVGLH